MKEKEIPLKIEQFSPGEESQFSLHSKVEIQSILTTIAQRETRVALYYNDGNSFALTLVLAVDGQGVWLDAAQNSDENRSILNSRQLVCVSSHNHAKVQFNISQLTQVIYQDNHAYYLPLPTSLVRLQRRDYFRLATASPNILKCVIRPIPNKPQITHLVTVMDISVGGVGLICKESDIELIAGGTYRDCQIELPDTGTLVVTLQVKSVFMVRDRKGDIYRRVGCLFIKPDGKATMLLQRYVAIMQRQAAAG